MFRAGVSSFVTQHTRGLPRSAPHPASAALKLFGCAWCFIMGSFRTVVGLLAVVGHQGALSFVPANGLHIAGAPAKIGHLSRQVARRSCSRPLAARLSDDVDDARRVGFATSDEGNEETMPDAEADVKEERRATLQTVNKRLLAQIEEQGKDIVIPTEESKTIMRREEDLNGVNPVFAILGAGVAAAMSFGSWKATLWFAQAYYSKPAEDSDILAVARLTSFIKQAVVGLFALGTGIFGVTALGMGIMAGIVAVGVAKGELDPSKDANAPKKAPAGASVGEVDRLMIEQAEERLRKAQADIEQEISGKV